MKSHDFGQFLFNSRSLNEPQLFQLISASRRSEPTLAVEALFLQMVSAEELTAMLRSNRLKELEPLVRTLITPRQALRAEQLRDGQSIHLAQALLDDGLANFLKLERLLERYHEQQVPPLEAMLTIYYERLKHRMTLDFPFAVDLIRELHSVLSETLDSTVIILPPHPIEYDNDVGASVKLVGALPVVTGIFSDERTFLRLAKHCDDAVETLDDAFDVLAELLNVFTGQFSVKYAAQHEIELEPEPPRCGRLSGDAIALSVLTAVGRCFVYVERDEIFA